MDRSVKNRLLILSALLLAVSIVFLLVPRPVKIPVPGADYRQDQTVSDITVSRIIDGDTYELSDGRTIRLIGVDTPETDMPFYDEAVAFAESLILGREITLEFDKEELDKYGRSLAYVYLDTIFVNQMMAGRGLGIVYLFESNLKHAGILIDAQKRARAADLGVWSLPDPAPEDYYVNIIGSYRFHRPLCVSIKNTDPKKRKIYRSREELLDKGFSPCRNCRP